MTPGIKQTSQWNRIESSEINPHVCGQIIFNKEAKHIQSEKESFFNKWCWDKQPQAKG